jgi:SET domain-containing protein
VWAIGSGCATFYNTSESPNTKMTRFFDEDRYEIHALRDIAEGEELTHVYMSLAWRECFADLRG